MFHKRRVRRALAFVATVLVAATIVVAPPAGAARRDVRAPQPALHWRSCSAGECARLRVPLDDRAPKGPTINLAVARVRARRPDQRIGTLLVNPGGPGESGVDFVRESAQVLPSTLRDRFDIVGFDPRGVGRTARIDCTDRLDPYYALEFAPTSQAQRDALVAGNRQLAKECEERDGRLLPYVSTRRTARDLDRLRIALGEDRVTYLGFSYGTYLGALYADQFPKHVRALVLDGAIDPALDASDTQVEQAVGFERSLDLFFADCAKRSGCAFHSDGHPAQAYDRLRAEVTRKPLPAGKVGAGRVLNGTNFDLGIVQQLYAGKDAWPSLADALQIASRGDGSELLSDADMYTGRLDDGRYGDLQEAFLAIGCLDGPDMGGLDGIRAIEERAAVEAPRLGRTVVNNSLACALWPVPTQPSPVPHAIGAPPILVLGTTNDPATPFSWAKSLASELRSGVLVAVDGARHTAFASGNACVDRLVTSYLVALKTPANGTRC